LSDFDNNSELGIIIKEVKQELKAMFLKRKAIIVKLGDVFEKFIPKPESICEEIKNVLRDEIAEKVISSRNIEMYCPSKWKRKTKPKNERISFSNKQVKDNEPIAIDNDGNTVENSPPSANEYVNDNNNDNGKLQISNHCERCEILEKRCEILQVKVDDYEDALKKASPIMSADQITTNNDKGNLSNSNLHYEKSDAENSKYSSNQVLDFEVSVPWKTMQRYLNFTYISGKPLIVWFNGKIDKETGNVLAVYPGRISERNKIENEEDGETTTT
jgi:hypothetical protein